MTGDYLVEWYNKVEYEVNTRMYMTFPASLDMSNSACSSTFFPNLVCNNDGNNLYTFSGVDSIVPLNSFIQITFTNVN